MERCTRPKVDISKEVRRALLQKHEARLREGLLEGTKDINKKKVFRSTTGSILDPDNLYKRLFRPVLERSGIQPIRFHDLRHTFGSLLIQRGASLVYVKEQMGHSSIQITVDTYGQLVPSANVCWVDRIDEQSLQVSATQAQPRGSALDWECSQVIDSIGGGAWTRTTDLRIMRPSL
jgi:integrase